MNASINPRDVLTGGARKLHSLGSPLEKDALLTRFAELTVMESVDEIHPVECLRGYT